MGKKETISFEELGYILHNLPRVWRRLPLPKVLYCLLHEVLYCIMVVVIQEMVPEARRIHQKIKKEIFNGAKVHKSDLEDNW